VSGLPTGTVTLLFTDIEGSTQLARMLGPRYDEILAHHRHELRRAFAAHRGAEVDTQGDSFFVAFERAHDAVLAAIEAQRSLARDGATPVRVRIGIHTGEPRLTSGGYYVGVDLSRGARICSAAHGGQVLLSAATRNLVADEVETRDLGEHLLKDIEEEERLYQLLAPGLELDFPPPRAPSPGNLSRPRTGFFGRNAELDALVAMLVGPAPVVTITGSGGMGKTRLALEVAQRLEGTFRDGTFFVSLAGVADATEVPAALGQVLGVKEQPGESLQAAVLRRLHGREILLILDNFESVADAALFVSALVEESPMLKVLVTSRNLLRLRAEHEFRLGSLPEQDAEALFTARAKIAQPSLDVGDGQREQIVAICRRLDGLPLALELAAARARVLPLPAILARLEQRLAFLTGGASDLPERQRTLAAAIEWSYALLEPEEQALLLKLAVFAGGVSLEAAEHVASTGDDALELLTLLRDKSLLVSSPTDDGSPRFTMLETIREFMLEQLSAARGEPEARRQHALYFAELAEEAAVELRGARQGHWLQRLALERDNLNAALAWALEVDDRVTFLRLAAALWRFWFVRGHVTEGRRWLAQAVSSPDGADTARRAEALLGAATLSAAAGEFDVARSLAAERLEICRSLGDDSQIASALSALANIAASSGENEEAAALYEEAATYARRVDAGMPLASIVSNIGYLSLLRGDPEGALATCREAAALFEELGLRDDAAGAWLNVATAQIMQREAGAAAAPLVRSLAIYMDLEHLDGVSYCLDAAAAVLVQSGDAHAAARLTGAADAVRARSESLLPPVEDRLRAEVRAEIEAILDEDAAAGAVAEGATLGLDEAVAVAAAALPAA
jgi:predicted ATPase/class 3 adenylate cyclase